MPKNFSEEREQLDNEEVIDLVDQWAELMEKDGVTQDDPPLWLIAVTASYTGNMRMALELLLDLLSKFPNRHKSEMKILRSGILNHLDKNPGEAELILSLVPEEE